MIAPVKKPEPSEVSLVWHRPRALLAVTLVGVISVLLAVATNIATNLLPDTWRIAPWLIWTVVAVLALASIGVGGWQFVLDSHRGATAGQDHIAGRSAARSTEREASRRELEAASVRLRPVPAQLPPDVSDFTGRNEELAKLRGRLTSARGKRNDRSPTVVISAIAGKPGIGKSALAIHLAHQLAHEFPDGQLYVNLRGAEPERLTPPVVLSQFLRALGLPDDDVPTDLDEQVARYRTLLAARRVLVVLDNAADAVQVHPLLPGSPTCAVLITSRNPFTVLEGANPLALDSLDRSAAVELLGKLVGPERVAAEPRAADAIARYCGYLPLALRIAGARLAARPAWPLAALGERLADERHRLTELHAGDLEVRASFALSYTSLPSPDARAFRLLGLLDGPDCTPGVAAALTDSQPADTEQVLERLADAQLLETPSTGRYRFHDLLRLFARERLADEEPELERRAALERALGWYLVTARQATNLLRPASLQKPDASSPFTTYRAALDWLETERPNIIAAVRQASEQRWDALTWQLAATPWEFFNLRRYWPGDWQETLELGLEAARRAGDRTAEAQMLHHLGYVLRDRRRFTEATALLHESLAIFRELGDRYWEGAALGTLGTAQRNQRQLEEAIAHYKESLVMRREVGNRRGEGQVLEALGSTYRQQQRFDEATTCLELSLATFREVGDHVGEGRSLGNLGSVYVEQQRFTDAALLLEQCLTIARATGATYIEGRTLADLARALVGQRRFKEADTCLRQSLAVFLEVGDHYAVGQVLKNFGLIVERVRGHRPARGYWEEALSFLAPLDDPDATKIRGWLDHPGEKKPGWSEWGV
jgi:tetratricopeptide (TPR) repeat protein